MSASIRPTRWPSRASAAARFADTVDFPTPPLPLEIASTLPSPGISSGVGGAGGVAAGRPDGRAAACPPPSAESTTFIFTSVTAVARVRDPAQRPLYARFDCLFDHADWLTPLLRKVRAAVSTFSSTSAIVPGNDATAAR